MYLYKKAAWRAASETCVAEIDSGGRIRATLRRKCVQCKFSKH